MLKPVFIAKRQPFMMLDGTKEMMVLQTKQTKYGNCRQLIIRLYHIISWGPRKILDLGRKI